MSKQRRERPRPRLLGEVQRSYVSARRIVNGNLLCLRPPGAPATSAPGPRDSYCAVLEVSPINFLLRSQEEQTDIISGFGTWLNALRFPVQILVQVRQMDLEPYVNRLRAAVTAQVEAFPNGQAQRAAEQCWVRVATDHITFVQSLARKKLLLERHFYVLLTFEGETSAAIAGAGLAQQVQQRLFRRRGPDVGAVSSDSSEGGPIGRLGGRRTSRQDRLVGEALRAWQRQASAEQQLDLRAAEMTRQLERLGLEVERLDGAELAGLYYRALTPERATQHPLATDMTAVLDLPTAPCAPWDFSSLADLLAPATVELAPDHLCLEGEYTRVLALTGYPRRVFAGWLARIIDEDMPLDVSLHIHPRDARAALGTLRRHLAQYEASSALDNRMGRLPDPQRRVAVEDVTRLQERIERGTTHVFDFGVYVRLYAARQGGLALLEHRTDQVYGALDHLGVVARSARWEQDLAFASILPEGRDALHRTRFFDTETIATAWPFSSSGISMSEGILCGLVPANGSLVILDPFSPRFENANQVVFGVSGGGKSYATKLRVVRSLIAGVSSIIVDPENEYLRLCLELGGQAIRLAPGSNQHINPFDLSAREISGGDQFGSEVPNLAGYSTDEDDPLADKIQSLHAFFDLLLAERGPGEAGTLSRNEKALLDQVIYAAYLRAGITSDRSTHSRPAPLLGHVYQMLTGPAYRRDDTTGLASRLHRYVEGSLSRLFAAPTDVELDNPLVVFNIADLDEELRPLGLYLVSDCIWTHVRRYQPAPRPRLLLVDEAWSLLQFPEGGRFLASLVRRARKRYLGVVTISQDINDFLGSEWGQTILKNSSTKLLMKQDSSSIDLITDTFKLSAGERRQLLASEKGEGLLIALGARIAIRVEASPEEHALATTDPRELEQLQAAALSEVPKSSPAVTAATAPSRNSEDTLIHLPTRIFRLSPRSSRSNRPNRSAYGVTPGPSEPDSAHATPEKGEAHHATGTSNTTLS